MLIIFTGQSKRRGATRCTSRTVGKYGIWKTMERAQNHPGRSAKSIKSERRRVDSSPGRIATVAEVCGELDFRANTHTPAEGAAFYPGTISSESSVVRGIG